VQNKAESIRDHILSLAQSLKQRSSKKDEEEMFVYFDFKLTQMQNKLQT